MSYATKFNKGSKFTFKTAENVSYMSLAEIFETYPDEVLPVKALYINTKSQFGNAPCLVMSEGIIVNLPKHLLHDVVEMIADDECVGAINNNEVGFKVRQYIEPKFNKVCYSIEWV